MFLKQFKKKKKRKEKKKKNDIKIEREIGGRFNLLEFSSFV